MTAITHRPVSVSPRRAAARPGPRPSVRPVPRSSVDLEPSPSSSVPHRVYVVRRLVVAAVALVLAVVVLSGRASASRSDTGAEVPVLDRPVYVVQPGDTLWDIADALAPGADRRDVVDRLARAAGGAELQPGQTIVLPPGIGS